MKTIKFLLIASLITFGASASTQQNRSNGGENGQNIEKQKINSTLHQQQVNHNPGMQPQLVSRSTGMPPQLVSRSTGMPPQLVNHNPAMQPQLGNPYMGMHPQPLTSNQHFNPPFDFSRKISESKIISDLQEQTRKQSESIKQLMDENKALKLHSKQIDIVNQSLQLSLDTLKKEFEDMRKHYITLVKNNDTLVDYYKANDNIREEIKESIEEAKEQAIKESTEHITREMKQEIETAKEEYKKTIEASIVQAHTRNESQVTEIIQQQAKQQEDIKYLRERFKNHNGRIITLEYDVYGDEVKRGGK